MPLGLLGGGTKHFLLRKQDISVLIKKMMLHLIMNNPFLIYNIEDVVSNLTIRIKATISRPTLGIMPSITYMYNPSCTLLHSRMKVGRN